MNNHKICNKFVQKYSIDENQESSDKLKYYNECLVCGIDNHDH